MSLSRDSSRSDSADSDEPRTPRRKRSTYETRFLADLGPFHDIGFFIGQNDADLQLVTCHKLALARVSDVFAHIFYRPDNPLDDDEPIFVQDISPVAFESMCGFAYTGEMYVETFDECCGLLYAAKKYNLCEELRNQCRAYLWANIYPNNVWLCLDFARDNDEPQLYQTALQILQLKTSKLLMREKFRKVSESSLVTLLQQENLSIASEYELYDACLRWAERQMDKRQLTNSRDTVRHLLRPVLPHLRLLAMSDEELNQGPLADDVLTDDEAVALFNRTEVDGLCPTREERGQPRVDSFCAFAFSDEMFLLHLESEYFENTYDVFAMAFSSSGDFFSTQLGVVIPTQIRPKDCTDDTYDEDLTVFLYNCTKGEMLSITRFKGEVRFDSQVEVPFRQPVQLKSKRVRKVAKVVFHRAGTYPARYPLEEGKDGELRVATFAGHEKVKLWHKRSYNFIHFCAYTVDSSTTDKGD
ncbi:uncharacterized protein LOC132197307 [Neocloeon triangulifer]|uniref:uncharacterized protein LOC132197307 n=1 Tax=Neocloeon triangulifer TaxID=2078957 RepID=UPI00286F6C77|nr:uncharacterized protein LOC132197307 [Neocloeon triangulifer]